MSRRQSRILIAAAVWTLYVWISRIVIMSGQDDSVGFKVVHGILAVISIGLGVASWGVATRAKRLSAGSDLSAPLRTRTRAPS